MKKKMAEGWNFCLYHLYNQHRLIKLLNPWIMKIQMYYETWYPLEYLDSKCTVCLYSQKVLDLWEKQLIDTLQSVGR